jgi:uncharacterized OB-fold protein
MELSVPTRAPADPRPVIVPGIAGPCLLGGRCAACDHPNPTTAPMCPRCGGPSTHAAFGPEGAIWAATTIHVASGDRDAPYTLAYVDLDDGPRVLTHVLDGFELVPRAGERVRLVDLTEHGDPQVEVTR